MCSLFTKTSLRELNTGWKDKPIKYLVVMFRALSNNRILRTQMNLTQIPRDVTKAIFHYYTMKRASGSQEKKGGDFEI